MTGAGTEVEAGAGGRLPGDEGGADVAFNGEALAVAVACEDGAESPEPA